MGWLTSLPEPVKISVDSYFETRVDPDDATKNQIRKRTTSTVEYRGVTESVANGSLTGYPVVGASSKVSRSFSAIGGGGYTVTQVTDSATEGWIPDPLDE